MKEGYLSQYFNAVAAKRLTAVEVNVETSNQHEFNGTKALKEVLGINDTGETISFQARFIWMGNENETIMDNVSLSWYDSRFGKPRAAEWRLFYPSNDVMDLAREGDLLFITKRTNDTLLCIIVPAGSTVENQLLWLFGVPVQTGSTFTSHDISDGEDKEVDFTVRFILDELGIDIEVSEADYLDSLLKRYERKFPTTREFSAFTRETLNGVNPIEEPDGTLMAWMEHEEKLFRRLERQIVDERLRNGFVNREGTDVEGFISFSMSVHQRRKSRAGHALELHLQEIFRSNKISYSNGAETENKSKPDFLFPGKIYYHSAEFADDLLTMLGVKTTCKDRWRQVLSEAKRINNKHLLTFEPGISENQTDEMRAHGLQLVLPTSIHGSYRENQRAWLMNVTDFIRMVDRKQKKAAIYFPNNISK